jgi:glutaredoxin 3
MATITIYTKSTCPYCSKAKALLDSKSQPYEEIDILRTPDKRADMIARA